VQQPYTNLIFNFVCFSLFFFSSISFLKVNDGDYLDAVMEESLAENVTRVLYPNDNVRLSIGGNFQEKGLFQCLVYARKRTSS
jgi:glucan phosphorylase